MDATKINLGVVSQAISILGDAVQDTHNALGTTDVVQKVQAYGDLVPSILDLAAKAGALPASVASADPTAQQAIVAAVANASSINPTQTHQAADGILGLLAELTQVVLSHSTEIAHFFKRH